MELSGTKRIAKTETVECPTCHRPGWVRKIWHSLMTEQEWGGPIQIDDLPPGYIPMLVMKGVTIHDAVGEGMDYCREHKVDGVAFRFNDRTVLVSASSEFQAVVRDWWKNTNPDGLARAR